MNLDRLFAQRFEHCDDQQAGRMIAKTIGDKTDAQRRIGGLPWMRKREPCARRRHAGLDAGCAGTGATQLLVRSGWLGEKAERRNARCARVDARAQPHRQVVDVAPVAELAAQEDELAKRLIEVRIEGQRARMCCGCGDGVLLFLGHQPALIRKTRVGRRGFPTFGVGRCGLGVAPLRRQSVTEHQQSFRMSRDNCQSLPDVALGLRNVA